MHRIRVFAYVLADVPAGGHPPIGTFLPFGKHGSDCFNRKSLRFLQLRSEPRRSSPLAHRMPKYLASRVNARRPKLTIFLRSERWSELP